MDFNDSQEYSQQSRVVASSNYPTTYLDLFKGATSPETPELAIPVLVYLLIYKSNRNYDAGWKENIYEVTHAQRNYDTLEEWFSENIIGRQLYGNR
jgi:hypothetical protein